MGQKEEMVGFGLRIIKEIPEFSRSSITTAVSDILNKRLPYDESTVGPRLTEVVRIYKGSEAAENVTAAVQILSDWLATQPHGKNNMTWIYPAGIFIMVLTGVLLFLRLWSRKVIVGRLGLEDWALVMATLMSLAITILMENSVHNGGGIYVWNVPWYKLVEFMKCTQLCPYAYTLGTSFVKFSLLIFYQRLSPRRGFQIGVYILGLYVCMLFFSTFIAMFFQCRPISDWTNPFKTKCFDVIAFWTAYGILNTLGDVFVWLLPVTVVWRLQMPIWEKIQILLLFALGLVVCVASTMRIFSLNALVKEIDVTSGEAPTGLWSLLELNLGIICACIPGVKSLITTYYNRGWFRFGSWGAPKGTGASDSIVSQELKPQPIKPTAKIHDIEAVADLKNDNRDSIIE